jgi:hypothetical protein
MSITVKGITTNVGSLKLRQPHVDETGVTRDKTSDVALGVIFSLADGRELVVPISKYDLSIAEFVPIENVYGLWQNRTRAILAKNGNRSEVVGYVR